MMRCKEVKELLEAYVENELSRDQKKAVETHISGCESCKKELATTQSIPRLISSLSTPPVPEDIIPNVVERMHGEPTDQHRWLRMFSVFLSRKWQLATVGLVLLVVVIFGISYYGMNMEPHVNQAEVASAVDDVKLALGIVRAATQDVQITTLTAGAKAYSATKSKSENTMRTLTDAQVEVFDKLKRNLAVLAQLQSKEVQKQ